MAAIAKKSENELIVDMIEEHIAKRDRVIQQLSASCKKSIKINMTCVRYMLVRSPMAVANRKRDDMTLVI